MRTSVPSSHEERRKRREKEQNMWTDYSNFLFMDVDTVGNDLPTLVRRIGTHPEDIYLEQSIYISKNDI